MRGGCDAQGHCHLFSKTTADYFLVPPWFDLELKGAKREEKI